MKLTYTTRVLTFATVVGLLQGCAASMPQRQPVDSLKPLDPKSARIYFNTGKELAAFSSARDLTIPSTIYLDNVNVGIATDKESIVVDVDVGEHEGYCTVRPDRTNFGWDKIRITVSAGQTYYYACDVQNTSAGLAPFLGLIGAIADIGKKYDFMTGLVQRPLNSGAYVVSYKSLTTDKQVGLQRKKPAKAN